jgi:hypothetical protein
MDNSFAIPTEEPSILFPVGAIIEDDKAKYKILEFQKQDKAHKYRVDVLERKIPIPEQLKKYIDDTKFQWILVLPQNLHKIRRLE